MIKFRTEVDLPEFKIKMGYRHQTMMIGSCFAENIGTFLQELCFPIMVNPFGILYNPISISNSLTHILSGKEFTEQDLFYSNGLYNSFSHHSRYSNPDPVKMLSEINTQSDEASSVLKGCSHLFITFGTAWVFKHKKMGTVVSNCHKLPSSTFDRFRLSVGQITATWNPIIAELKKLNPDLQIVFTVSPIRHLKDGAHENQISKSLLIIAIEELISEFGNKSISYFPSYELVLDELRDYRFYAADMTHLSEVATEFIRERFMTAILDHEAKTISAEVAKLIPALNHRPLNTNRTAYISFIENQLDKAQKLQNKYPFVDLKTITAKLLEKRDD